LALNCLGKVGADGYSFGACLVLNLVQSVDIDFGVQDVLTWFRVLHLVCFQSLLFRCCLVSFLSLADGLQGAVIVLFTLNVSGTKNSPQVVDFACCCLLTSPSI